MWQFVSVILAFFLLSVLTSRLKWNLALSMAVCGLVIHLFALRSLERIYTAFINIFSFSSVNVIATIFLIGVLSSLMKHYQFLDGIISSLKSLLRNRKLLLGMIPFIIGTLSVPGGALLSAPFADDLGKEMDIAPEKRVVINLSFRHIGILINPFSTPLLFIAASIPNMNIYHLILLNIPFALIIQIGATLCYMPRHCQPSIESGNTLSKKESLKNLLKGLSPIILAILLNGLFHLPMSAAIALSIVWVWAISPKTDFIKFFRRGCSLEVPLILIAVYFIQNTILQMTDIMNAFNNILQNPSILVILFAVIGGCLFIGLVTGMHLSTLGVFIPIMLAAPMEPNYRLLIIFFLYIWSILGYYYSPLHLCQLLTIKYIKTSTKTVYKEHLKLFPWLAAASFGLYYLYRLWLL